MENQTKKNKRLVLSFIKAVETDDFGSEFDKIVSENYNDHLEGQQPGRDRGQVHRCPGPRPARAGRRRRRAGDGRTITRPPPPLG